MSRRAWLLVLALTAGLLVAVPVATQAADGADRAGSRLRHDADGPIRVVRGAGGAVRFVGTAPGSEVRNPGAASARSVRAAARAHLDRYGAALGAQPGSRYVLERVTPTPAGVELVRYRQEVSGVPVLGGEVALDLAPDRGLRSLSSRVSAHAGVGRASVSVRRAARIARAVVARSVTGTRLQVTDQGRWLLDPAVLEWRLPGGARTVRRFLVGNGTDVARMILVDDGTGAVLGDVDQVQHVDRVVCDRQNARGDESPCTSGFVRTETSGATGDADIDHAFDYAGATQTFYETIAHRDLTNLIGVDVGGVRKLAATVRFCTADTASPCPFPNAFWNGQQMFYGAGYSSADDVVGHEMTHGFIDRFSALFYWGQSGAINESMADVIGEFIDHRNPTPGDSPTNWDLGEDLPGGPLRNLADPTLYGQPDRMTSALYTADQAWPNNPYLDNGGVHTDSGVGNKTAYLISQGGTFNGQSITGIDEGDPTLTKSSQLYVLTIERLLSGSDYADLARTLEQSCSDLVGAGLFVPSDCDAVHQATVATELTVTPANAAQPADAPMTCPAGSVLRVLFDGEADPVNTFDHVGWQRPTAAGDRNATSGTSSWYAPDYATAQTLTLKPTSFIALPAGQPSYLWFQQWRLLDYEPGYFYDGGLVRIETPARPDVTQAPVGTWVNGPADRLSSNYGNAWGGADAFGGDSDGWIASRQDLSEYAGQQVKPHFILSTDSSIGYLGWYLDDIRVYTCDPAPSPTPTVTPTPAPQPSRPTQVSGRGHRGAGAKSPLAVDIGWRAPATAPEAVTGYRISASGLPTRTVGPGRRGVRYGGLVQGQTYRFAVQALGADGYASAKSFRRVLGSRLSFGVKRVGNQVRMHGRVWRGDVGYPRRLVYLDYRSASGWRNITSVRAGTDGRFHLAIGRKRIFTYRIRFWGGPGVSGSYSPHRRR